MASTQVSRYEKGRAIPHGAALGRLARALGVNARWLAFGEGPQESGAEPANVERPHVYRFAVDPEKLKLMRRAAEIRGISVDELVQETIREAMDAAQVLKDQKAELTVGALYEEMQRQKEQIEELTKKLAELSPVARSKVARKA